MNFLARYTEVKGASASLHKLINLLSMVPVLGTTLSDHAYITFTTRATSTRVILSHILMGIYKSILNSHVSSLSITLRDILALFDICCRLELGLCPFPHGYFEVHSMTMMSVDTVSN